MNKLFFGFIFLFFPIFTTSIPCFAEPDVAVLHQEPEHYERLAQVSADSRNSRARGDKRRRKYVLAELQRQAAEAGADAVWVLAVQERVEKVAEIGGASRFSGVRYRKISYLVGTGVAVKTQTAGVAAITEEPANAQ